MKTLHRAIDYINMILSFERNLNVALLYSMQASTKAKREDDPKYEYASFSTLYMFF